MQQFLAIHELDVDYCESTVELETVAPNGHNATIQLPETYLQIIEKVDVINENCSHLELQEKNMEANDVMVDILKECYKHDKLRYAATKFCTSKNVKKKPQPRNGRHASFHHQARQALSTKEPCPVMKKRFRNKLLGPEKSTLGIKDHPPEIQIPNIFSKQKIWMTLLKKCVFYMI